MKKVRVNENQTNEKDLILKAQKGDIEARNRIIENNLFMVKKTARKLLYCTTLSESDLINEGIFAIVIALEKFNVNYGTKFATYACWWVKQAMFKAISEQSYAYSIPVYIQETVSRYNRMKYENEHKGGDKISKKDIAKKLRVTEDKLDSFLNVFTKTMSIDSGLNLCGNREITLADIIEDEKQNIEKDIVETELKQDIKKALDNLLEKEKNVIVLRFGLEDNKKRTLEDIGLTMGVSKECVRQIEKRALNKIALLDAARNTLSAYIK